MGAVTVLAIDDEPEIGALIEALAETLNLSAHSITDPFDIETVCRDVTPSVIFLDLNMPGMDGIATLNRMQELGLEIPVYLMSGYDTRVLKSAREFALSKGIDIKGILTKPFDMDALEEALLNVSTMPQVMEISGLPNFSRTDLLSAIARDDFVPFFQPKVRPSAGDGPGFDVIGSEALARWHHPELGLLSPAQFVRLVEEQDIITELTLRIFESVAVTAGKLFRETGLRPEFAVNVSPGILHDVTLPDLLENFVLENGLQTGQFKLGVTESAVAQDVSSQTEILTRFRLKGFSLSIDDFGTGFSSVVQLYRLPFNELKIDQTFVKPMKGEEEAFGIVKAMVQIARSLHIAVCAEGCEDQETFALLFDLGVDSVQGYYISKPLSEDRFVQFLLDGNRAPA